MRFDEVGSSLALTTVRLPLRLRRTGCLSLRRQPQLAELGRLGAFRLLTRSVLVHRAFSCFYWSRPGSRLVVVGHERFAFQPGVMSSAAIALRSLSRAIRSCASATLRMRYSYSPSRSRSFAVTTYAPEAA